MEQLTTGREGRSPEQPPDPVLLYGLCDRHIYPSDSPPIPKKLPILSCDLSHPPLLSHTFSSPSTPPNPPHPLPTADPSGTWVPSIPLHTDRCLGSNSKDTRPSAEQGRSKLRPFPARLAPHHTGSPIMRVPCSQSQDSLGQLSLNWPFSHSQLAYQNMSAWTSLVVQWLRIHLPMQRTRVRALVGEDPTCYRATKSMCHNY